MYQGKKQTKNNQNQQNYVLQEGFVISDLLYNEIPLYIVIETHSKCCKIRMSIFILSTVEPCYIRVKSKLRNINNQNQQNYLLQEGFVISDLLYNEIPLYFEIDLFTNVHQIYGCFFPRDLVTSHFINLYLTMVLQYLESTLHTLIVAMSDKPWTRFQVVRLGG